MGGGSNIFIFDMTVDDVAALYKRGLVAFTCFGVSRRRWGGGDNVFIFDMTVEALHKRGLVLSACYGVSPVVNFSQAVSFLLYKQEKV